MPLELSSAAHSYSNLVTPLWTMEVSAIRVGDIIHFARSQARAAIEFDPTAGSPPDIPVIGAALLI
jgi:hypothetical protein